MYYGKCDALYLTRRMGQRTAKQEDAEDLANSHCTSLKNRASYECQGCIIQILDVTF